MVTLSMYFNVKMTVRCEDAYQSVSVAVGKELSCQLKGGSIHSCGDERQVIVGREKFQQFARCMDNIVRGVLYYPCSMVLWQFFCQFTGSAAQTRCARCPQLVSKKVLEEIFAVTNFRKLAFDRENRENFCLAKISCNMVFLMHVRSIHVVHLCSKSLIITLPCASTYVCEGHVQNVNCCSRQRLSQECQNTQAQEGHTDFETVCEAQKYLGELGACSHWKFWTLSQSFEVI